MIRLVTASPFASSAGSEDTDGRHRFATTFAKSQHPERKTLHMSPKHTSTKESILKRKHKRLVSTRKRQDIEHLCEAIANIAQEWKVEICRLNKGPADLPARLFYRLETNRHLLASKYLPGNPVATFPEVWEEVLAEGSPDFLAFVSEGYGGPPQDDCERGDLAREFRRNPDSAVTELLLIAAVDTRQGRHRNTMIPFRYDEHGVPQFKAYPWWEDRNGNVPELLSACVRQVQRRAET